MIELKIKNGAKKIGVKVPRTRQEREEIKRRMKILEFDIKRLELDLQNINDPETKRFAEKRLEELKWELSAIKAVVELVGGEDG